MHAARRRPSRGFTLIELLVALAIVAMLLGVAAPDFSRTLSERALAAQVHEFMAALRFARAEAMKRGQVVGVCASDPAAPATRCRTGFGSADWRSGWIVFATGADPGAVPPDAEAQILRIQRPLDRTGGVAGTRRVMKFTAAGFSTDAAGRFLFEPPAGARPDGAQALLVCVSKQGKARLAPAGVCS
jgi:type IV fimbrial biogenesis protein FimT